MKFFIQGIRIVSKEATETARRILELRELILELAVRGLLVPQDPTDEPASELVKEGQTDHAGAGCRERRLDTTKYLGRACKIQS